jgi:dihydroanticapsin dehydrogenase
MKRLDSKVAIITGGASGMGEAAARRFCAEGASVVLADIQEAAGLAVEASIRQTGGEASFIRTDLTVEADVENLVTRTVEKYGAVDVLFSNAGVKNRLGTSDTIPEGEWDRVFDTNVKGTFFCVKHAVRHMVARQSGSIIVNASVAGFFALPSQPAYNASKAAQIHFAKSVAADFGKHNVRCNVICPGPIGGAFATKYIYESEDAMLQARRGSVQLVPMGRIGTVHEVADVAVFLASPESSFVNGAMITIDGGMSLGADIIGLSSRLGGQS